MIAGVMGGIAQYLGWSPTWVRVLFVIISSLSAAVPGILIYIILWIVMPKATHQSYQQLDVVKEVPILKLLKLRILNLKVFGLNKYYSSKNNAVEINSNAKPIIIKIEQRQWLIKNKKPDTTGYRYHTFPPAQMLTHLGIFLLCRVY